MLMFMGLVLLVWFITAFLNKGNFKSFLESSKEFEGLSKEDFEKDEKLEEKSIVFAIKAIGIFSLSVVLIIVQVAFLISAFSVDFLILPTLLMLGVFIYKLVRLSTSKEYREKQKAKGESEKLSSAQLRRGINIASILYILVLIIIF